MLLKLSPPLQALWLEYRRLEGWKFPKEAEPALVAFMDALPREPESIWRPWALSVAAELVDRGGYQVRQSLFERVLFPALQIGIDRHEPNCARWLGSMAQHLYRCRDCMERLGPALANEESLYRRALADDPTDRGARKGLIKVMAYHLSYSLHELPSGVLFGHNGATPSQCQELRSYLAEFQSLTTAEGCTDSYSGLIQKCQYHFIAYEQYLTAQPRPPGYPEFMAQDASKPPSA